MNKNPDVYLLYEYSDKVSYTVKIKVTLDSEVDVQILTKAARQAIVRFPYFSVQTKLDEGQNYTLVYNDSPVAVLQEKNRRIVLGSDEVNGHLIAITYPKPVKLLCEVLDKEKIPYKISDRLVRYLPKVKLS